MEDRDKKLAALRTRAQEWFKLYPDGEPMFTENGGGHVFIESKQIMRILDVKIRTAQNYLHDIREVLGKSRNAAVSLKAFCFLFYLDEEDIKKNLGHLFF